MIKTPITSLKCRNSWFTFITDIILSSSYIITSIVVTQFVHPMLLATTLRILSIYNKSNVTNINYLSTCWRTSCALWLEAVICSFSWSVWQPMQLNPIKGELSALHLWKRRKTDDKRTRSALKCCHFTQKNHTQYSCSQVAIRSNAQRYEYTCFWVIYSYLAFYMVDVLLILVFDLCVCWPARVAQVLTTNWSILIIFTTTRDPALPFLFVIAPPRRGIWSPFGGVCSLTYCNGNFRVTMVSEPFNVFL